MKEPSVGIRLSPTGSRGDAWILPGRWRSLAGEQGPPSAKAYRKRLHGLRKRPDANHAPARFDPWEFVIDRRRGRNETLEHPGDWEQRPDWLRGGRVFRPSGPHRHRRR